MLYNDFEGCFEPFGLGNIVTWPYLLSRQENVKLVGLLYLVLMSKVELLIDWWLENRVAHLSSWLSSGWLHFLTIWRGPEDS